MKREYVNITSRCQGKSQLFANRIKYSIISAGMTGLPCVDIYYAMHKHIVKWNMKTGEVSTIEYNKHPNYRQYI